MEKFDYSNIKPYKVYYIIIVIIVILLIIYIKSQRRKELKTNNNRKNQDGNGDAYYLGRGSKDDSSSELLDRIDWSTYLNNRITYWNTAFIISIIIIILIIMFIFRKVPPPGTLVLIFFLIFIPIYAVHQFQYTHGDVYNDYYIKRNVELLRKKFGFKKEKPRSPREDNIPDRTDTSSI